MQSIRAGGFAAGPEAQRHQAKLPRSFQHQREPSQFTKSSSFRYCGSRGIIPLAQGTGDEPPMTACGGNFIGGEISRNEQSLLWRVATIEAADREGPCLVFFLSFTTRLLTGKNIIIWFAAASGHCPGPCGGWRSRSAAGRPRWCVRAPRRKCRTGYCLRPS